MISDLRIEDIGCQRGQCRHAQKIMIHQPSLYTVESVTSGHPDKICDQISDAILDTCLREDPLSRVAVETFGGHGLIIVGGEVTTRAVVDYSAIARDIYRRIGYSDNPHIITNIALQSPDIAQGVDTGGAGDQGIMYGYATNETASFLPKGVVIAHALTEGLERLRRTGTLPWLGPDGKAQVSMRDGVVTTVLVSAQHTPEVSQEDVRQSLIEHLIIPVVGDMRSVSVLINPTGAFTLGGFAADTGLTGRKIMVDTYGGFIPHGGGAFSGKDATKVDRSAAYMARFVAKNAVEHGLAARCLVSVAYAIGKAQPVMVTASNERGEDLWPRLREHFDFRPQAIIERLDLRKPIFLRTATYGHFGKPDLPWEKTTVLSPPL